MKGQFIFIIGALYVAMGTAVLSSCAATVTANKPIAMGTPVDEVVTSALIDFNFGLQSDSAQISIEPGETENTINITIGNLYNVLNPPATDRSGTFALMSLPQGYVTDLEDSFAIEYPAGSDVANVKLGEFRVAEGSLTSPVNGNIKTYIVRAIFQATLTPLLPSDIMATFSVGIAPNIVTEQGMVALNGSTITISGLTNALDDLADYPASGALQITARPDYFTVDQTSLPFDDPSGYETVTITLPQTLQVTDATTRQVTVYTIEIVFLEIACAGLGEDDIVVTYRTGTTPLIYEEATVEIIDARIVITGLDNPPDSYRREAFITITARPEYFTVDQTRIDFKDNLPAGTGAATIMLPRPLQVTNTFTRVVTPCTIEIRFDEKLYIGLMPSDIVATFTVTTSATSTSVTYGEIVIEGTTIIISGFTNARDDLTTSGRIDVTERASYFRRSRPTVFFADAPGLGAENVTSPLPLNVTNRFDSSVTTYTFRIDFAAQPFVANANAPTLYMTEIYKKSRNEFVVEIYVEDVPGVAEKIPLSNYGLRSMYLVDPANPARTTTMYLTDFDNGNQVVNMYEGVLYSFIYVVDLSQIVSPRPYDKIYLYYTSQLTSGAVVPVLPDLSAGCAVFELYENLDPPSANFVRRQTVDYLRFGDNCPANVSAITYSAGTWERGSHAVDVAALGATMSLARSLASSGEGFSWQTRGAALSFSGTEWAVTEPTPSLPTDATCVYTSASDADSDGIYDCLEDEMTDTLFGMPLYEWGARTGQVDLFLEIDYMTCGLSGSAETQPYEAVLTKMVDKFVEYNIALHIDIGGLYDTTPDTLDPSVFNLGGGNNYLAAASEVGNYDGIRLSEGAGGSRDGVNTFYTIKEDHFSIIRKQIFYYMIVAKNGPNVGGNAYLRGEAELPGNDSVMALRLADSASVPINYSCVLPDGTARSTSVQPTIENRQYYIMMHEFGHNLGLKHGGGNDTNHKPNYKSVMNYGYQDFGSASQGLAGTNWEADNYYLNAFKIGKHNNCDAMHMVNYALPIGTTDYDVQFSDGTAAALDETALNETSALFPSSSGVDYNCNGMMETSVMFDVNFDGSMTMLSDYDDVGNMGTVFFKDPPPVNTRSSEGAAHRITPFFGVRAPATSGLILRGRGVNDPVGQTIYSDRQPVVVPYEEGLFFRSIFGGTVGETIGGTIGTGGENGEHGHEHGIIVEDNENNHRNVLKASFGVVQQLFHELGLIWARVKVFIGNFYK